MLVAMLAEGRVEADRAVRGPDYVCPECRQTVILRQGRIRVAHFAHRPAARCGWAAGETLAHLGAKKLFQAAFLSRGLQAEVEQVLPSLPRDRRADVMVWSPAGAPAAIELQHSNIALEEIEERAFSYAREGIAQAWVPFLSPKHLDAAKVREDGAVRVLFVERYPARPFERWAHDLHGGRLWFYEPKEEALWLGRFAIHMMWVQGTSFFDADGEEVHVGGYYRLSKQWRELTLRGPYGPDRGQAPDRAAPVLENPALQAPGRPDRPVRRGRGDGSAKCGTGRVSGAIVRAQRMHGLRSTSTR